MKIKSDTVVVIEMEMEMITEGSQSVNVQVWTWTRIELYASLLPVYYEFITYMRV